MKNYTLIPLLFICLGVVAQTTTDSLYYNDLSLDEVKITSFKQTSSSVVASSSSIISDLQLKNFDTPNIKELSAVVPNFYMPDYGSKQSSPIYVRGIGSKTNSPSVGLYIDGVPHFESSAFDFDLEDIASIELLRGPQGTLYGRNTSGGILNVRTHSPLDYQATKVKFGYGNRESMQIMGSTYNRLSEKFGVSLMANYRHSGGFFENVYTGEYADKQDNILTKLSFEYRPNDRWQFRLNGTYDYTDQNGYPYAIYDTETQTLGDVSYNHTSTYLRKISTVGFNAQYTGTKLSFNSQSSYQHIDDYQDVDQDFSDSDLYYVLQSQKQDMFSQEFTLKSNTDSPYQHITGLFAFAQEKNKQVDIYYVASDFVTYKNYDTPIYGAALYHQSSIKFAERFTATAGVRLDYEYTTNDYVYDKSVSGADKTHEDDYSFDLKYSQITPKFSLQYDLTDNDMIYTSVTRGYRAGGFNTSFDTDEQRTYSPEYNWNYEVGTKLSFWEGALTTDLSLFYIDWKDQQITQVLTVGTMLENAGHSVSKGVELSVAARVNRNLRFTANYGYTDAVFKDYEYDEETDYSGNYLPLVPRHTASLQGSYTLYDITPLFKRLMISLSATGVGDIYWHENNLYKQDFYTLLNSKVSAQVGDYTIELWGKNLTSTDYLNYLYTTSGVSKAQGGKPVTYGCNLIYMF